MSGRSEYSLFIGNLSSDVDDYKLYFAFSKHYRSVHTAKVVFDSSGKSKSYGFVRFSDEKEQLKALIEMQHTSGIGSMPIRVSLASSKSKRHSDSSSSSYSSYYSNYASYPGSYPYGNYAYAYNPYYSAPSVAAPPFPNPVPSQADQLYFEQEEDLEVLEDPCLEINIDKENEEFIESSESFFTALEKSRWNPLDHVTSVLS